MTPELWEKLYNQLKEDIYIEDYSAIYELLKDIEAKKLISYISNEN